MEVPDLPLLQLSSSNIDRHGAYLLDTGDNAYLYIGSAINEQFCKDILGKQSYREIVEGGLVSNFLYLCRQYFLANIYHVF